MVSSDVFDIDGCVTIAHRSFSHLLDRVGSEYLAESKYHDAFGEHCRIPLLQPDLGRAVDLVMICADYDGEAWAQIHGSVELALHYRTSALVEFFSFAHLSTGEERTGFPDILNHEQPIRRGLRKTERSVEEKGCKNFQHSNHLIRGANIRRANKTNPHSVLVVRQARSGPLVHLGN